MVCSHWAMLWSRFLANQRLVDMRDDTTASNRRLDQAVQFLYKEKKNREDPKI